MAISISEGTEQLIIEVLADTKKLKAGMADVEKTLKDTSRKATKDLVSQKNAWDSVTNAANKFRNILNLGGIGVAFGAATAALRQFDEAMVSIASRGAIEANFNKLGISLEEVREATAGLVTDTELMTKANQLATGGINITTEQYADLSRQAVVLGQRMGYAGDATNALYTGILRGSPRLLDNIGLYIDGEKAMNDYAESIGKTAMSLSDADRIQATFIAVQKQLNEKVGSAGPLIIGYAGSWNILSTSISNATATIGQWWSEALSPDLHTQIIRQASEKAAAHAKSVMAMEDERIQQELINLGINAGVDILQKYRESKTREVETSDEIMAATDRVSGAYERLGKRLEDIDRRIKAPGAGLDGYYLKQLKDTKISIEDQRKSLEKDMEDLDEATLAAERREAEKRAHDRRRGPKREKLASGMMALVDDAAMYAAQAATVIHDEFDRFYDEAILESQVSSLAKMAKNAVRGIYGALSEVPKGVKDVVRQVDREQEKDRFTAAANGEDMVSRAIQNKIDAIREETSARILRGEATDEDIARSEREIHMLAIQDAAQQSLNEAAVAQTKEIILTGKLSTKVFKQIAADRLASIAAVAAVEAVKETAYAIAALAIGGPFMGQSAALHFQAAAQFAGVAAVTGIAARGMYSAPGGGKSRAGSDSDTGFRSVGGKTEETNVSRQWVINIYGGQALSTKEDIGAMILQSIDASARTGRKISRGAIDDSGNDSGMSGF